MGGVIGIMVTTALLLFASAQSVAARDLARLQSRAEGKKRKHAFLRSLWRLNREGPARKAGPV